ncbi:hypothetical protein Tco_0701740 [Tanacetum coccineum]
MSSIAKFDVEKFDGSNDFGLWRVKMRCLLIQHGWEAALDPFPETMADAEKTVALKTDVYKKAHSALLLCLDNKFEWKSTKKILAAEVFPLNILRVMDNGEIVVAVSVEKEFDGVTVLARCNISCAIRGQKLKYRNEKMGFKLCMRMCRYIPEFKEKFDYLGTQDRRGLYREVAEGISGLPDSFWAEATVTTAYLINRSPSTALEKKTPMDLWDAGVLNESLMYMRDISRVLVHISPADSGKEVEFEVELQGSRVKPTVDPHTGENPWNEDEEQDEGPQQQNLDNYNEWVRAMNEEMSSLKKNHTWELVDQPPGQKLISCKWLYKIKEGIEGVQKPRVILSLTTCEDYELEQLDVKDGQRFACKSGSNIANGLREKDMILSELGPARKCMGMEIVRDMVEPTTLKGCPQSDYVQNILNNNKNIMARHVHYRNIAYAVRHCGQYWQNPVKNTGCSEADFEELKGTAEVGLCMVEDQGKSHGCLRWKATLQHVVALSTTEAEYMALTEVVKERICLKRTKHIKVRYHFIREIVESKEIEVVKIGTDDNAADAFTKVIPGPKFKYYMEILGVGSN